MNEYLSNGIFDRFDFSDVSHSTELDVEILEGDTADSNCLERLIEVSEA